MKGKSKLGLQMDVKGLAAKSKTFMEKNAITHLDGVKAKAPKKGKPLGVHEFSAKKLKMHGSAKMVGAKGHHKFI